MAKIQDIRNQTNDGQSKRSVDKITKIGRHHSATTEGDYFAFWNGRWKGLGWNTGGYHELILRDGTVQLCYDANVITNGIKGHNTHTYHICVVGNGSFTDEQEEVFEERCKIAMARFGLTVNDILGHKEFSGASTACPGIDMDIVRGRLNGGEQTVHAPKTEVKTEVVVDYIQKGDEGSEVVTLQKKLISIGYELPKYGTDGDFGQETEDAVKAFQKDNGLTVDGIVGPNTASKLVTAKKKSVPYPGYFMKLKSPYMRGEAIKEAQKKLGVTADGIYGPKTANAVQNFQRKAGLNVDSILGPKTWSRLFE